MILRDVAEDGRHAREHDLARHDQQVRRHAARPVRAEVLLQQRDQRASDEDDIASESVKQAIKKIIEAEDERSPYSDQEIVEILGQQKIVIARRTVAKYREMLGILSSSKRKKYF